MRRSRLIIPRDNDTTEILPQNELVVIDGKIYFGDGINQAKSLPQINKSNSVAPTATSGSTAICTIPIALNACGILKIYIVGAVSPTNDDRSYFLSKTINFMNHQVHGLSIITQQTDFNSTYLGSSMASFTPSISIAVSSGQIVVSASGVSDPMRWSVKYELNVVDFTT